MSVTTYFKHLDGFNDVSITRTANYGVEKIKSFRWVIECDQFIYKSRIYTNWSDQVWERAKTMYRKELRHVVQP